MKLICYSYKLDLCLSVHPYQYCDSNQWYVNLTEEDGLYTRSTKQDMPWVRQCRLVLSTTARRQILYISMTLTSSRCMVSTEQFYGAVTIFLCFIHMQPTDVCCILIYTASACYIRVLEPIRKIFQKECFRMYVTTLFTSGIF